MYPDFKYKADEVSKYLYSEGSGLFTLALKYNTTTVHFTPEYPEQFKQWLDTHNIEDIKQH